MPRETYSTTAKFIAMDSVARGRVDVAVPLCDTAALRDELRIYGSNAPETPPVDAAYVRTHAIAVGLNRFPLGGPPSETHRVHQNLLPTAASFTVQEGDDVLAVAVDVVDEDLALATAWADWLEIDVALVLSCALCTGLVMVMGGTEPEAAKIAASTMPRPAIGPFVAPPS